MRDSLKIPAARDAKPESTAPEQVPNDVTEAARALENPQPCHNGMGEATNGQPGQGGSPVWPKRSGERQWPGRSTIL
jgi:hypothetical protein